MSAAYVVPGRNHMNMFKVDDDEEDEDGYDFLEFSDIVDEEIEFSEDIHEVSWYLREIHYMPHWCSYTHYMYIVMFLCCWHLQF